MCQPKITVALLAGGKSSRMGQNKAILTYEGKSFLERLIEEFSAFDEVIVSVKDDYLQDPQKIKVVKDENQDCGPLEGLRRALSESRNDFVFVSACDMPFVTKEVPLYIAEFFSSDYECYVPLVDGRPQPLCAVYKKSILPAIENQLKNGDFKLSHLFEKLPTKFIPVEKSALDKKVFTNVNTPDEYKALKKPFIFCVSGIKNSGKTRMVCALIKEAQVRGYKCGVIKHDGHDCFTDAPGTDTYNFTASGAVASCIFSDKRFMFGTSALAGEDCSETLGRLINQIKSLPCVPDFIILEGLKDSDYPKVEVLRSGISEKSVCREPVIYSARDDYQVEEVFNFIEEYFMGKINEVHKN